MPETLIMQPAESYLFDMDFAGLLRDGETISSVVSVVASPSGPTIGSATISGQTLQFRVSDATADSYTFTALVNTSLGNKAEGEGFLEVKDLP